MRVFEGWRFTLLVSVVILAMSASILGQGAFSEPSILDALRATARTSAILFLLAFAAPGIRWGSFRPWFQRNTPFLLLAFAGSHLIHFAILVTWLVLFPHSMFEELSVPLVVIALVLYGVIVMLARSALRSTKTGSLRLHSRERLGMYVLWAVFTLAFFARALTHPLYPVLALASVAALILRLGGRNGRHAPVGEVV
jgi:sulfoxide reductase heme-binding subunit YedZ